MLDADTGLHYNRYRYYDPTLGRYLQSDPIGLAGGLHLYAAPGNPISTVDLLGLNHGQKAEANAVEDAFEHERPARGSGIEEGHVSSYAEQNLIARTGDGIDHDHIHPRSGQCRTCRTRLAGAHEGPGAAAQEQPYDDGRGP